MNHYSLQDIISIPSEQPLSPSNPFPQSLCDFKLTKTIGKGTFGTVRLAENIQTGEEVAIKILEKVKILQLEDKTRVEREIKILKCLRHSNIVQLYSVIQTDQALYLIMEYVPGKELFDYIIANKRLSEKEACKFYQQIISGVEYLHKLKIVHRDIKPENLLLDSKTNDLKIVDFGLSNIFDSTYNNLLKSACGSPCYAAPEMLGGKEYTAPPVDIWSSGIVLYAMLCGFLPFEHEDNEELYKKICEGKFTLPPFLSDGAKDLLTKILNTDPTQRITIPNIKQHPWFNLVNQNLNINEGLLLNQIVIPIDETVVNEMVMKYNFLNKEEIRASVLSNRHNDIATIYYLIMRKKIREGYKSIADLKSELFLKYVRHSDNLYANYNYDFNNVIQCRGKGVHNEIKFKKPATSSTLSTKYGTSSKTSPMDYYLMNKRKPLSKSIGINKEVPANNNIFDKYNKKKRMIVVKVKDVPKENKVTNNKLINSEKFKIPKSNNTVNKKGVFINVTARSKNQQQLRLFSDPNINKQNKNQKQQSIRSNTSNTNRNGNSKQVKLMSLITESNDDNDKEVKQVPKDKDKDKTKTVQKKKSTHPIFNQYLCSKRMIKSISPIKRYTLSPSKTNYPDPISVFPLNCISLKTATQIKDNLIQTLSKLKLRYRLANNKKIIMENVTLGFIMEIKIIKIQEHNINVLKFKLILGSTSVYSKFTKKILSKLKL